MPHYKIAIVGAGPSGYFAAQALQNSATEDLTFSIDMIERLPTPWGLVRSGVAPDHPKIKTVSKVPLSKSLKTPTRNGPRPRPIMLSMNNISAEAMARMRSVGDFGA